MNLQTLTQGNIRGRFAHMLPLHLPNFPDAACGPQKETIFSYVAVNIDFPHAEVVERANRDAPNPPKPPSSRSASSLNL